MDYLNQTQGTPEGGPQGQPTQPQPGGLYQFQPGIGFVQVQGAAAGPAPDNGQAMGQQAAAGAQATGQQGAADASAQAGMFGQQMPEGANPKFDQNKLGKIYGTVSDVMNGEADPSSLVGLFAENGGDFWKGALVGAAAVVLLNNDAVKGALSGVAGSVGAMFGEKDPEGEQVTVDGK
jgi:hypothetical protein